MRLINNYLENTKMEEFKKLGVGETVLKAVAELGFEQPTPIQQQAIPVLIQGNKDFIGLAQTGTGKTAAFGLPLLQIGDFTIRKTQALILAPTRELCVQIARDIESFGKYTEGLKVVAVYGGASIQNQISQIRKGVQVVVATPGRLLDMIDRRAVDISQVQWVVLDEADEMLNMGFQEDINSILSNTPAEKKVWLFSATMPAEVRRIANKYMTDPHELTVGKKNAGAENIEHIYYVVHARDRYAALKRIVDFNPDIFGIVFCRTKMESQDVAERLMKDGYNADALHGDLSQQQRDKVMGRFRDKSLQLLIATDVAARGIDVSNVTHIINYNLPDEIENYTHRSGRTARAGKSGISIAIINMKEVGRIKQLERQIGKQFTLGKIPDGFEVCEKQLFQLINKVHNVEVNEEAIKSYLPKIYEELKDLSKEDLIKRFTSIEFNRFLEYYRNAPSLNADGNRDSYSGGERFGNRLFINVGSVDGFDKGSLLNYVCTTSNIDGKKIGKIDIKGVYSFFEIDESLSEQIMNAFKGEVWKSRSVRIEKSGGGKSREGGQSRYGGNRSEGGGGYGGGRGYEGKKSYGGGGRSYGEKKSYGGDRKKSFSPSHSDNGHSKPSYSKPSGDRPNKGFKKDFSRTEKRKRRFSE